MNSVEKNSKPQWYHWYHTMWKDLNFPVSTPQSRSRWLLRLFILYRAIGPSPSGHWPKPKTGHIVNWPELVVDLVEEGPSNVLRTAPNPEKREIWRDLLMDFFYNTASSTPLPCFFAYLSRVLPEASWRRQKTKNNANATKNTSLSTQTLAKVFNWVRDQLKHKWKWSSNSLSEVENSGSENQ
jgi:hypothetical protein